MSQRHRQQNDVIMLITTNTDGRQPIFENPAFARETIETLYRTQERHPFLLYGFVIMPDHCHLLLKVPRPGSISKIMNVFKGIVSLNIGKGPIWQSRFHLSIPPNPQVALQYIWLNPVRGGLCEKGEEYPWSSASGKWDVARLPDS